jgi:hypothetical protein
MEASFIGHRAGPGDVLGSQNHALVLKMALRLSSLFRKDKAELDLSDELRFHLQNQIIIIGIALALLLTRLLGNLLYQVSPRDPLAFATAFAVMTLASAAACFLPAWRATRTDPIRALRAG